MGGPEKTFDDLISNIPESRKAEALRKLIRHNNRVKIWVGGSENDRYDYPYRLTPVHKATERIRDVAQELMIDSSIQDTSITNKDVIQKATKLDAQYVIPKDYWGDIEATHQSILEFIELYKQSDCRSKIIVPMQPPHGRHYKQYEDFYKQFSHFAIGGMKESEPEEQIKAVEEFRNVVGDHKWVHGLGMGSNKKMVDALRTREPFLDSIDISTFETVPGRYGSIAGKDWKQEQFNYPSGENAWTLRAIQSEYLVHQLNFQMTPFAEDNPADPDSVPDANQSTLSDEWNTNQEPKDSEKAVAKPR